MYKVMIVDDFDIFREEIRSMDVWGESSGFVITAEASSGRDAIAKLQAEPVDLLITDIRMPIIDGIELMKKALGDGMCKCVVLMSQFSDFEYARQGIVNGAFEYLLKPVESGDLLRMLQRAAKYIAARDLEQSRITYLENILENNVNDHYPGAKVKQLLQYIGEGSEQAAECAAKLVDTTWSEVDYDHLKTAFILNKVTDSISETVSREYPWIEKIGEAAASDSLDYSELPDVKAMKEHFVKTADTICRLIRTYEFTDKNNSLVRSACRMVLENLDSHVSLSFLSKKLFISLSYLSQLFKKVTGMNLIDYITMVKMERAKYLLANSRMKSYEIAFQLGYKSDDYFSKLFKKSVGMTPTAFRQQHAGG
jgi:two-component system response regulator YesN